jgi:hypothetical protein
MGLLRVGCWCSPPHVAHSVWRVGLPTTWPVCASGTMLADPKLLGSCLSPMRVATSLFAPRGITGDDRSSTAPDPSAGGEAGTGRRLQRRSLCSVPPSCRSHHAQAIVPAAGEAVVRAHHLASGFRHSAALPLRALSVSISLTWKRFRRGGLLTWAKDALSQEQAGRDDRRPIRRSSGALRHRR